MMKRIFSLMLSLVMILSLFSGMTVTVDAVAGETYVKVTDAADLAAGDVIILVYESAQKAGGAMGSQKYFASVDASITAGSIVSDDAIEITLGGEEGSWTMTTSEGSIGATAAKNLNHTGSGTTTWTIAINDGNAVIASTTSAYGTIQYNASSPRFMNYASAQSAIQIYKKVVGGGETCTHPNAQYQVTTEPTCTQEGERSWSCPDCSASGTEPVAALGHAWNDGAETTAPSCTEPGVMTFTCTRSGCGATRTEGIPAAGHVDANGDNICDVCLSVLPAADVWVLADSISAGDRIMFVYPDQEAPKAAGPISSGNYLTSVDAAWEGDDLSSEEALIFEVEAGTESGTFAFANDGKYLKPRLQATSGNNYVYLEDTEKSADTDWTVTFEDGIATVAHPVNETGTRYLKYNSGSPRFSTYVSGQQPIAIYKAQRSATLVDVYFVDQDHNEHAYVYAFGDGTENAAFPGVEQEPAGTDENGHFFYKVTVDRDVYTNVIFSGGSSATQTADLSLGDGAYVVYYVNNHVAYLPEYQDLWPSPGTRVEATCTEDGYIRYYGLLTGAVHERVLPATGHSWSAWSPNGNNTHSRSCANDVGHVETGVCVDSNNDGVCDLCPGAVTPAQGDALVTAGGYVLSAKVGDDYYALPNAFEEANPAGVQVIPNDGAVQASAAAGCALSLVRLTNGAYAVQSGGKYLGWEGGDALAYAVPGETILLSYAWNVTAPTRSGSFRLVNASDENAILAVHVENNTPTFCVCQPGDLANQDYYDLELVPVLSEETPENIDVYFVDQTNSADAYVYYYNANKPADDTAEDIVYPGKALDAQGTEKDGYSYYCITLSSESYTHVYFNNGQDKNSAANRTPERDFLADSQPDPREGGGNNYVVYYVYNDNGEMKMSPGADLWPAPIQVISEPTCLDSGLEAYVGKFHGTQENANVIPALGHEPAEPVEENRVEPTATAPGHYDSVVYCQRCTAELSRTPVEIPALAPLEDAQLACYLGVTADIELPIGISVLRNVLDGYDDWYVELTWTDDTGTEQSDVVAKDDPSISSGTYFYVVRSAKIPAKQCGDTFQVQAHAFRNGQEYVGPVKESSIKDLLVEQLKSTGVEDAPTYDPICARLCADILNYCASLQLDLDYKEDELCNEFPEDAKARTLLSTWATGAEPQVGNSTNTAEPNNRIFVNVSAQNRVVLGITVYGFSGNVEIHVTDGEGHDMGTVEAFQQGYGKVAYYRELPARGLRASYTYTVFEDGVDTGLYVEWSLERHVYGLISARDSGDPYVDLEQLQVFINLLKFIDSATAMFPGL